MVNFKHTREKCCPLEYFLPQEILCHLENLFFQNIVVSFKSKHVFKKKIVKNWYNIEKRNFAFRIV